MNIDWESLRTIAKQCWQHAEDKGFHEGDADILALADSIPDPHTQETLRALAKRPGIGMRLALIHSKVSEALEAFRNPAWHPQRTYYKNILGEETQEYREGVKGEGLATELADIVIRVFDLSGSLGIDIAEEIRRKMDYNATRSYRHGGKRA